MRRISTSLGKLVQVLQDSARSDAEVVLVLAHLFSSGRTVFVRNLRGELD